MARPPLPPPRLRGRPAWPRRLAWAAAGVALAAGAIAWWLPPAPTEQVTLARSALPSDLLAPGTVLNAQPHDPAARPSAPSAQAPASTAPTEVGIEVCGYGRVQLAPDDPNPLQRIPAALRLAALEQAEARLAQHPRPVVRAAALLIGARARPLGGRSRIQQLARLAAGSQDPLVYGLAVRACQGWSQAEAGECALITHGQWSRLEPGNAQVWLERAAEAAAHEDTEAETDAMQRAGRAAYSDERLGLLTTLVAQALGPQVPALQRTLMLSHARSIERGWSLVHTSHADRWCNGEALAAEPEREPVCDAVARALATRSVSLASLGDAAQLGRRLGWPAATLAPLLAEQQAIHQLGEGADDATQALDLSCAKVEQRQAWARRVGEQGELTALRARVKAGAETAPPASRPDRR